MIFFFLLSPYLPACYYMVQRRKRPGSIPGHDVSAWSLYVSPPRDRIHSLWVLRKRANPSGWVWVAFFPLSISALRPV